MELHISEHDEAGRAIAAYVSSESSDRIEFIKTKEQSSLWMRLLDVFLPAGYPHSVTRDYMWYQIYDSLQAFSSSIAGLLASRAVLQGETLQSSDHTELIIVTLGV
ncbi:hypothetical protein HO173_010672 [Letharia columbiana]|uniref:Protein root UVB sensitive/RUS domain-containing protein n=1 Tax=Letharia columbiana TaxID=112416 RepID=A0A8H6FMB6_9LECA|nr:uncharacterized protein HO173_010672 [Letharia columbiana]KAF6231172.1 hypothetical protein HO173_010672 [Letharia columbiana]